MLIRTQLVAYPGAGGDTTDAGCGQHGGGVALVFLLLLELDGVRGRAGRGVVVVAAVAVGVAEEAALVVGGGGVVVGVGRRGSVRAGRQVGGGIPLRAACGLLDVAVFCVSLCTLHVSGRETYNQRWLFWSHCWVQPGGIGGGAPYGAGGP